MVLEAFFALRAKDLRKEYMQNESTSPEEKAQICSGREQIIESDVRLQKSETFGRATHHGFAGTDDLGRKGGANGVRLAKEGHTSA
ncbi:MAG TPA: hypothetical protein VH595_08885 [Verrucomicrobiae bacterium]|nr:hypothetical protein [Verrucomicrobiae bacterium]